MYVVNYGNNVVLVFVVNCIVYKYVVVGIKLSYYLIVVCYLLGVIVEVLGDVVMLDLFVVWDEVYWLFVVELIVVEVCLY